MNEHSIIDILFEPFRKHMPSSTTILDDAAFLPTTSASHHIVTSQDMLIENIDFKTAFFSAADIGYKALAVNLSDLAAMGAEAIGFTQSLALPNWVDQSWLKGYASGIFEIASQHQVPLLGGDLSKTDGPLVIAISIFGKVISTQALHRRRTKPGDILAVTGFLGKARAGLEILHSGIVIDEYAEKLILAQKRPQPQLHIGQFLKQTKGCRGAIDLSDGLGSDIPRFVSPAQGVLIDSVQLPICSHTYEYAKKLKQNAILWALSGGEDFVLLTAFDSHYFYEAQQQARHHHIDIFPIGVVTDCHTFEYIDEQKKRQFLPLGYDHFSNL